MSLNPNPSVLAALPEEQQQQILGWLDIYRVPEVVKMTAAPPPKDLGISTHPNSVKRFYAKRRAANIKDSSELAAEILRWFDAAGNCDARAGVSERRFLGCRRTKIRGCAKESVTAAC